jgi:hypothetical protein
LRQVAVGHLGQMPEARLAAMREQRIEESAARFALDFGASSTNADPRLDEGTGEPRPGCPLVIGLVALHRAASVARVVVGMPAHQGPQPERRPELRLDDFDDASGMLPFEDRDR